MDLTVTQPIRRLVAVQRAQRNRLQNDKVSWHVRQFGRGWRFAGDVSYPRNIVCSAMQSDTAYMIRSASRRIPPFFVKCILKMRETARIIQEGCPSAMQPDLVAEKS